MDFYEFFLQELWLRFWVMQIRIHKFAVDARRRLIWHSLDGASAKFELSECCLVCARFRKASKALKHRQDKQKYP